MGDAFWPAVLPALLGGGVVSLLADFFLEPRPLPFWQRPLATTALHLGIWFWLVTTLLLVLQRPYFAAVALLAGQFFVILVSNAKYHALREPFLFQDFEYFRDALRHPRLYLPFLGVGRAALAIVALVAAVTIGLALEEPLPGVVPVEEFLPGSGVLVAAALLLLALGGRRRLPLCFDVAADLRSLGLVTVLWRYGEEEVREAPVPENADLARGASLLAPARPTLVAVQSESFFDPRPLFAGIRRQVLSEFDALCAAGECHGSLEVAAWGANTVRSEFAFLSGLAAAALGVHRFNPYRRLVRQGVTTLAGVLRQCGYRTVCIHPYSSRFYSRDRVYPLLGFDAFIDQRAFAGAARCGPFVADGAVAEEVRRLLRSDGSQPLFLFVITMENHGPLHLETVAPDDVRRLYLTEPPLGCDDLTVYLRHLANADCMLGVVRRELEAMPGESVLCWFGDHVPIMPEVYRQLGTPDGTTNFVVWRKGGRADAEPVHALPVDRLAQRVLQAMASR